MEITLKELLDAVLNNTDKQPAEENELLTRFLSPGDYVIVRSQNEGINAGTLVECGREFVVLDNARRMWYHEPADRLSSWYEGVAESGLSENSKVSGAVSRKVIVEDYSITLCSEEAKISIEGHPAYVQ